jgi:hypothetical protein
MHRKFARYQDSKSKEYLIKIMMGFLILSVFSLVIFVLASYLSKFNPSGFFMNPDLVQRFM